MSAGAHCAAMRSSSACTNSLHCRLGVSRRAMALRTSSSKGASGISSDPRTPPLFLIAVRTSSSVSSLRQAPHKAFRTAQMRFHLSRTHVSLYPAYSLLTAGCHESSGGLPGIADTTELTHILATSGTGKV